MLRKLLIPFFILAALSTFLYCYINFVFLPVHLKQMIATQARELLNRDVRFDQIRYNPVTGFSITKLRISRDDDKLLPFAEVEEVRFNIFWPALIRRQNIVLHSLTLKKPYLHIIRRSKTEWNFSDLFQTKKNKKTPLSFSLTGISIDNGHIDLTDLSQEPVLKETFLNTNLDLTFSIKNGVTLDLASQIPASKAFIKINGQYQPISKNILAKATLQNVNLPRLSSLFFENNLFLVNQGFINSAQLQVQYEQKHLQVSGTMNALVDFTTPSQQKFSGLFNFQDFTFKQFGPDFSLKTTQATAKDAFVSLSLESTLQGFLTTEGASVSFIDQKLSAAGNFQLDKGLIIYGEKQLSGDFAGQNLAMQMTPKLTTVEGHVFLKGGRLQLTPENLVTGDASVEFLDYRDDQGRKQLKGRWEILNTTISFDNRFHLKGNFARQPLNLTFQNDQLSFFTPFILTAAEGQYLPDKFISGKITSSGLSLLCSNGQVTLQSKLDLSEAVVEFSKGKKLAGKSTLDLTLRHDAKEVTPWTGEGTLNFEFAQITGLEKIGPVSEMTGRIIFNPSEVQTSNLKFNALNTTAFLSGQVTDFANPVGDLTFKTDSADITSLSPLIANQLNQWQISPTGTLILEAKYNGPLTSWKPSGLELNGQITSGKLAATRIPEGVEHITGDFYYTENLFRFNNLRGLYKGEYYTLHGEVKDFDHPLFTVRLISTDKDLSSSWSVKGDVYDIYYLRGKYFNTNLNLKGQLSGNRPEDRRADLEGQVVLDVRNLGQLPWAAREKFSSLDLHGQLTFDTVFTGPLSRWQDCRIKLTGRGKDLSFHKLSIKQPVIEFSQTPGDPALVRAKGTVYDGELSLEGSANTQKTDIPLKLTADLTGMNLKQMAEDMDWKKKDSAGLVSGKLTIQGPLLNTALFTGDGHLSIKDGQLWEINMLKGLGELLFIPEFKNVVFTEGSATFKIVDSKFTTNDLILKSASMDLTGKGSIGFDQNINLRVYPRFREIEILRSSSLKKGATLFLSQTEGFLDIRITGTLAKPTYKATTVPGKVIGHAKDWIVEGLSGIFEEILP